MKRPISEMQNRSWTDTMIQVLERGIAGVPGDRCEFSPPSMFSLAGSPENGGTGQCMISNYNFFNSADPKIILPSSINLTNNVGASEGHQSMMGHMQYPGRGLQQQREFGK